MTKKFLFALLFASRLTRLVAWLNRKKVTILCYHSVTRQQGANPYDHHKLHLNVGSFLRQLDYLQAHCQIISLSEFVRIRREGIKPPSNAAILTFDDGFRNFFTVVAPLLLKKGIPATSFIVTGEDFTQESSNLNEEWRREDDDTHLAWNEVCQLANLGFEFGSHTCTHAALPDIPPDQARSEIEKSLNTLTAYLGPNSFSLSYPHGRTSEGIRRLLESQGYACALTSVLGQNDSDRDLFELRRTLIASDDDLPTFAARLSGLTFWYSRFTGLFNTHATPDLEPSNICHDPLVAEEYTASETF
jgi:peptidoglycan/xylan/chitin deacetylase (PgdA/CDA1 family)